MASPYLIVFLAAFCCSVVLTRWVRRLAYRHQWLVPPSARDVHIRPLPRLGGVAVFLSVAVTVGWYLLSARMLHTPLEFPLHTVLAIMGPAALVFLLGLVDDLHRISAYHKLPVQVVAAVWLFVGGVRFGTVSFLPRHELGLLLSLGLTVAWVLLITNAFNLIDGLDGLAAGSAFFSTLVVTLVSLMSGDPLTGLVAIALGGGILGFLPFNFNPATIFLGDCGSLFVGFVLAAVSIATSQKTPTLVAVAIPVVSFGLPILDVALSVFRRFLSGKPLFSADREHIHHKLLARGLTQRQAVVLLYAVSATFGLVSLGLLQPRATTSAVMLAILGIGVCIGVQRLGYHEVREIGRLARRTIEQRQIIGNNLAIRRAIETIDRCSEFERICTVLEQAFMENAYQAFELNYEPRKSTNLRYGWTKREAAGRMSTSWTLRLELVASDGERCGSFAVVGSQQSPLLADMNCLTGTDFCIVLADALQRCTNAPMLPVQAAETASGRLM